MLGKERTEQRLFEIFLCDLLVSFRLKIDELGSNYRILTQDKLGWKLKQRQKTQRNVHARLGRQQQK